MAAVPLPDAGTAQGIRAGISEIPGVYLYISGLPPSDASYRASKRLYDAWQGWGDTHPLFARLDDALEKAKPIRHHSASWLVETRWKYQWATDDEREIFEYARARFSSRWKVPAIEPLPPASYLAEVTGPPWSWPPKADWPGLRDPVMALLWAERHYRAAKQRRRDNRNNARIDAWGAYRSAMTPAAVDYWGAFARAVGQDVDRAEQAEPVKPVARQPQPQQPKALGFTSAPPTKRLIVPQKVGRSSWR